MRHLLFVLALLLSACASNPAPSAQVPSPTSPTSTTSTTDGAAGSDATPLPPWEPEQNQSWHIQYTGPVDLTLPVQVYNLDHESTSADQVARLKSRGVRVICYINAGAWEDWRNDAGEFPAFVRGKDLDGWPGERWLDIRQQRTLLPIMEARIAECDAKGFDAVDADNVDGYTNDTGFPLAAEDQASYVRALADITHRHGLAYGLKNNVEQVDLLTPQVDFATNERCLELKECQRYAAFTASGRPVFHVEYAGNLADVCARRPAGFSTVLAGWALDGPVYSC